MGAEIDPIRLIRRIKNGLEIPGLKAALIKILHDFNLQRSLLEGCQTVLNGDCVDIVNVLYRGQGAGFSLNGTVFAFSRMHFLTPRTHLGKTNCPICSLPLIQMPQSLLLLYLCRHVVHAACASKSNRLFSLLDETSMTLDPSGRSSTSARIAM